MMVVIPFNLSIMLQMLLYFVFSIRRFTSGGPFL
jgi:hypothetical protein